MVDERPVHSDGLVNGTRVSYTSLWRYINAPRLLAKFQLNLLHWVERPFKSAQNHVIA
jgi:hypothetical protein